MKKIIIVANASKEHIRKFCIPFIDHLHANGWTVDVACRLDVPVPECDTAYDLPCDRNPFRGGLFKSVKALKEIIRKNEYDILVCSTVVGAMIARLAAAPFRKKGLKVIYMCHGIHFFPGASLSRWAMGYPVEKLLAPKTDAIIVTNDLDLELANQHLKRIPVIEKSHSMGVNLSRFRDADLTDAERTEKRSELGLAPDDYVLSYVAEIIDNKNQIMLVNAFEIIRKTIPNAKLVLIGPEHDNGELQKLVESKGLKKDILFLGWRSDVPELLHLSDIYVASSKSEGLGLNLIEAMACNIPVVATRNRGHLEIVKHEQNGFLVDVGDSEAMANYVLQLHSNAELRKKITAQAQLDIEPFGTDSAMKELVEMVTKHA